MSSFSFPRPSSPPVYQRVCRQRPILPLQPLPQLEGPLPTLPPPSWVSLIDDSFISTTHLYPGAFPRSVPDLPSPALPRQASSKEEWKAAVKKATQEFLELEEQYRAGNFGRGTSKKVLWLAVTRYVRRGLKESKGLTLVLTHSSGYPKEIWEPVLRRMMILNKTSSKPYVIDEVWSYEHYNHGDSAVLNGTNLPTLYDTQDGARDLLHFLLHYMPSNASSSCLPTHLERVPGHVADERTLLGFHERTIVCLAQSLGGTVAALAAVHCHTLFSSLILVDPYVLDPTGGFELVDGQLPDAALLFKQNQDIVRLILQRRDHWNSREEARESLSVIPLFSAWDTEQLDIYVQLALRDDPAGGVTLKMPSVQEAMIFNDFMSGFEVWDILDEMDERMEVRFVMPARLPPHLFRMRERLTWRRLPNSSHIVLRNSGHLMVQEVPMEMEAQDLHQFLQRKYGASQVRL